MPAWAEVLRDGTIGREEPLSVARGLESLHTVLPLPGGLMRVLRPVIEVAVLTMFYAGKKLSLGGSIAFELVGDDHARHVR